MNFVLRFVSWIALAYGLASIVYFISLALNAPYWCAVLTVALGATGLAVWLSGVVTREERHSIPAIAFPILLAGLILLFLNSFSGMEKWGGWDAWAIWNHRAAMLQEPQHWQRAFLPEGNDHPDYPLCLPAGIAFFTRLLPGLEQGSVAVATAWGVILLIVLLLFSTLYQLRPWVGIGVLLLLVTDKTFLKIGLSQYADPLLALYFLLACIAFRHIRTDKRAAAICGAALGLCFWTKNEGALLGLFALLFFGKDILAKRAGKAFLAGLLVPLAVWIIFKTVYAPEGDMLNSGKTEWLNRLGEAHRYQILWTVVKEMVAASYGIPALLMGCYIIIRANRKRAPGADFMLLSTVFLAYCGIYLVTPYDPEWHLRTSFDRLLHQLMPAAIFVCAAELSRVRFVLADEQPY